MPMWFKQKVQKMLPEVKIPTTLQEAVDSIIKDLSDEDLDYIIENDSHASFDFGMGIRNKYGLWKPDSPLRLWFKENLKISHPDDISGTIIQAVFCDVRGIPFDIDAHIESYAKHWKMCGCDPMTGQPKKK